MEDHKGPSTFTSTSTSSGPDQSIAPNEEKQNCEATEWGSGAPPRVFQDAALRYVSRWCAASREFLRKKVERWKLLEDLYHNRRELNAWGARSHQIPAENRASLARRSGTEKQRWQADIILSPSYIVDSWTDRAYQSIFSGPEWLTVISVSPRGRESDDLRFPASYKLQELLLARLEEGQVHVRLYEILQHLILFGSVYAKVFWYSKSVTRHRWEYESLEILNDEERVYDCPIVQVIPLDRVLLDWTATHGDVQRHTGIGHRVDKTYEHCMEQFERGVYHLNRGAFLERWRDAPAAGSADDGELLRDEDAEDLDSDETRTLTVWEWHGSIPTSEGHRECLCTIVTEKGAETPENGILVRLTDRPVLWCGLRPFVAAHYTPLPGPLGMGAVESNLDLIHAISQFISQSQDNARLTANAQLIVRRGSSAARQISAESDVVYPGKVWTVDDPGDVQPFPAIGFPQHEVNGLIDYLNGLLEKRTNVSETTLGVAGNAKTATEAHILQESSVAPFTTRTDLFARSFLEPLGRLALAMLQQFVLEEQIITIRDSNGEDVPLVVTPQEIQSGRYRVVATLTRQDSSRIAKAQSIERVLPTLAKFEPLLAREGVKISFSEIIKRYLDLIGVDGVDRVISRMGPQAMGTPEGMGGQFGPSPVPRGMPAQFRPGGSNAGSLPSRPPQLVENGGPLGPEPTDLNALAQMLQMERAAELGQRG